MNKIFEIIQDAKGQFSAMRFVSVLGVATILIVWTTMCFKRGEVLNVPEGVVYLVSILVVGKMGQKYIETKNEMPPIEAAKEIAEDVSKGSEESE